MGLLRTSEEALRRLSWALRSSDPHDPHASTWLTCLATYCGFSAITYCPTCPISPTHLAEVLGHILRVLRYHVSGQVIEGMRRLAVEQQQVGEGLGRERRTLEQEV